MNRETLKTIMTIKGISQSELARRTGLTRQTISKWFQTKGTEIKLEHKNALRVAQALRVKIEDLQDSIPILGDPEQSKYFLTAFAWDKSYKDLSIFIKSLLRGESHALGRLVGYFGLYDSEKIVGSKIWALFPQYKKHLHPAIRNQLEAVWNLENSLT